MGGSASYWVCASQEAMAAQVRSVTAVAATRSYCWLEHCVSARQTASEVAVAAMAVYSSSARLQLRTGEHTVSVVAPQTRLANSPGPQLVQGAQVVSLLGVHGDCWNSVAASHVAQGAQTVSCVSVQGAVANVSPVTQVLQPSQTVS